MTNLSRACRVTGSGESDESSEYRLALRPEPGRTVTKTVVLDAGSYPVVCVTDTAGAIAGEIRIGAADATDPAPG